MIIGGFQKLTLLDYPGQIACIIFTKGCNFRCPFCHNANLVCQNQHENDIKEEKIISYLQNRNTLLDGVVISGGEPLIWNDLDDLLIKIHDLGLKIKLDTNGSFPEHLQKILNLGLVDYVAMDIKHAPQRYETACGIKNQDIQLLVKKSLDILTHANIPFELRTTIVKGIHTPEDIIDIAKWIKDIAPYYLQPYVYSNHIISPNGLSSFAKNDLKEILSAVQLYCPSVVLRG